MVCRVSLDDIWMESSLSSLCVPIAKLKITSQGSYHSVSNLQRQISQQFEAAIAGFLEAVLSVRSGVSQQFPEPNFSGNQEFQGSCCTLRAATATMLHSSPHCRHLSCPIAHRHENPAPAMANTLHLPPYSSQCHGITSPGHKLCSFRGAHLQSFTHFVAQSLRHSSSSHPYLPHRTTTRRLKQALVVAAAKGKTQQKPSPSLLPVTQLSAPMLTETPESAESSTVRVVTTPMKVQEPQGSKKEEEREVLRVATSDRAVQNLAKKVVRQLASLPLAIAELFAIAGLSAVGTVIQQGERPAWYFENYSDAHPVLGFLTWQWVLALGLDRVYTSPIFLGLLAMLAASLMACTSTTQLPIVKVARRWSFLKTTVAIGKLEITDSLPRARIADLGTVLAGHGFQVFARGSSMYAFKGLPGRLAPIGVHAALLLIMAGGTLSAAGGLRGTVMVPQGLDFKIGDALGSNGFLGPAASVLDARVQVKRFYIDYRPTGEVGQFHSDLSIVDSQDQVVSGKTISVNDPMRFGGVTIYQTDWGISAVQLRVDGSDPYNLVMAALQKGDNKLFGTFLPLGDQGATDVKGISILARDLQSVVIYNQEGQFAGVRRPGSKKPIQVDNVSIVVDDLIGSTGLELKVDPGVPLVYAGFGGLMLTTVISYLSHSQVWALQDGTWLVVGGKSNRAKLDFERELNELLDLVPEIQEKQISSESASQS